MAESIIVCNNISKTYGTIAALKNITVSIYRGETTALVGANGAGKSTFFNIILGLLRADQGTCSILGTSPEMLEPRHRASIGFIADHAGPIPWASSFDLAKLYAKIYPLWDQEKFEHITTSWHLDTRRPLNHLSKGQKRLAEIALVTALRAQIMILDEPFDGLDAVMRIKTQKLLRTLQREAYTTIIFATHILSEISSVADRMLVLRDGELAYDQSIDTTPESPEAIFKRLYTAELEV